MGLLECASGASVWRGYDYYKKKKIVRLEEIGTNAFSAKVSGNSSEPYSVELHIDHPRKSKCNCPHANGKRIICKHIVATYFTVLPDEAEKFYTEATAYQEEEEKRQEEFSDKVCHYVWHMKKSELQEALLQLLFEGPDWQFDRFVRQNGLEDDW
ncbi:MAG: SWIM zinc finger family protein [Oscillospiraceae bacterium]|nr:SWIM zinc finger family protein [Oscillospiraceae bacterium]